MVGSELNATNQSLEDFQGSSRLDGDSMTKPIEISDDSSTRDISQRSGAALRKRDFEAYSHPPEATQEVTESPSFYEASDSNGSPAAPSRVRIDAYNAMVRNLLGDGSEGWEDIGLISTTHHHTHAETELGDGR